MKFLLAMLGASVVAVSPALATDLIVPVTPEERATHSLDTISSLQIGGAFIGSDDSDYDGSGIFKIGGETRIHMSRERFAVQFEGLGSSSGPGYDPDGEDSVIGHFQGGMHLIHRDPNRYAAGAFVSVGGTSFASGDDDSSTHIVAGAEWAHFFRNTTLVFQGGGAWDLQDSNDGWDDGWFIRGIARYFVTPTSRLEAEIAYAGGEFDCCGTTSDEYALTWGLEYEHDLASWPVSGFVAYDGTHIEGDNDYYTEHAFSVGIRARLGGLDAMAQDRHGAGTFDFYDYSNIAGIPDEL